MAWSVDLPKKPFLTCNVPLNPSPLPSAIYRLCAFKHMDSPNWSSIGMACWPGTLSIHPGPQHMHRSPDLVQHACQHGTLPFCQPSRPSTCIGPHQHAGLEPYLAAHPRPQYIHKSPSPVHQHITPECQSEALLLPLVGAQANMRVTNLLFWPWTHTQVPQPQKLPGWQFKGASVFHSKIS